jgi:hypothetical protein
MSGHVCKGGSAAAHKVEWIKIEGHAGIIGANERCHALVLLAILRGGG